MKFRRPWLVVLILSVAALSTVVVRMAPKVMHGHDMEKFCTSVPDGLDRKGLTQMAEQQGYIVTPGLDAKGDFLRVDDDRSSGDFRCEARFKPDGRIASMNFSAGLKTQSK